MKVNPKFVLRNIYGKNILMPVRKNNASDEPILLNDIAAEIWKEAEKSDSIDEIVGVITKEYNIQKNSQEEKAVKQFVNSLIEQNLLFV